MPKKMGVNSKAEEARARKTAAEAERKERDVRSKEDQLWREAEGAKSRASKKREEEAEKKAEAAARRAEVRRLAEQEEKELEKLMKKPDKKANRVSIPVPKVTEAELRRRREEEQAALHKKDEEVKKRHSRTAAEEEYERMVLVTNTNRDDSIIEARTVEDAIAHMTVADSLPPDRHPERRLKASFKAFEDVELPRLKEEKPGLTHNQYKDMIWKLWKKSPDNPLNQVAEMVGRSRINLQRLSFRSKPDHEKRSIIVGLKSDNYSREILLRLLTVVVKPEDSVLAIHVQDSDDSFDPNTFHIHEDLCKTKQVDFQVKVCIGDSYISVLTHQVRLTYATILALGSSISGPNVSALNYCLKALPPTCTLLVINNVGRILLQRPGTSQQGSRRVQLRQSLSSPSHTGRTQSSMVSDRRLQKSLTAPSPSTTTPFLLQQSKRLAGALCNSDVKTPDPVPNLMAQKLFQRLSILEGEGCSKHFSLSDLRWATNNFNPIMLIGEGGQSRVYKAIFEDGQTAAVKVLKTTTWAAEDLLREIDLLSRLKHENIVEIIGYCDCGELQALVYQLLRGSLKQNLRMLDWSQRMSVAVGVAKALNYLHHSCDPPIIHRDVKSSNILLTDDFEPQLSDFGSAMILRHSHQTSSNAKPVSVVGTFGYLAPEYMMYGKVDEKIDVYSYGVVLLELITGKEAIKTDRATHESLVLWARSLLSYGLCDRLIDPYLHDDYNKEEMKLMVVAARLCLMHSSSRRPTMKTILRLFEEPEYWISMQRERDEFLNGISSKCEIDLWKRDDSVTSDTEDD
ncbi:hypothetical protein G4B88_021634 [Cannabis sativa]|uniref:Protein kinase domain-containing protein n=2 Tax=Cannabis sativa TaxID=3483 RepID=A0A7J6GJ01_CANSA|nr:hypothetical protein G4B88_021634 [Cannabis sativa]